MTLTTNENRGRDWIPEATLLSATVASKSKKRLTRFFIELRIVQEFQLISQKIQGVGNAQEMAFV